MAETPSHAPFRHGGEAGNPQQLCDGLVSEMTIFLHFWLPRVAAALLLLKAESSFAEFRSTNRESKVGLHAKLERWSPLSKAEGELWQDNDLVDEY